MTDDLVEALLEASPDPVWVVGRDGAVVAFNQAYARWTAFVQEEGAVTSWKDAQQRALNGRAVVMDAHLVVSGVERNFAVHAHPVKDGNGAVMMVREIAAGGRQSADLSIELALNRLFASEESLGELLAGALEFLCVAEQWEAGILWLAYENEGVLRAAGSWFSAPETAERLRPRIAGLAIPLGRGVPGRAWAQSDVVWIADILDESTLHRGELAAAAGLHCVVAIPLLDGERVVGVLELFAQAVRPISERRKRVLLRTGQALARLLERRRAEDERKHLLTLIERKGHEWMMTFDSIELPIFLVTVGSSIARLNRAACGLAGGGYDDLLGSSILSLGDFEPWTTINDIVAAVSDSGVSCTAQISRDDRMWDVAASLLAGTEREEHRVIVVLREITEIVGLQESVRRGEQLAALGELVAGVAHEVRNPLFGIGLTVDLLQEHLRGDKTSEELTSDLRKWLVRLNALMEKLLEYGKTWTIDLKPGRLHDVVQQAVDSCAARAADAEVSIEVIGNGVERTVLMDGARLVQVFENLLMNAIQHSPRGNRVTIASSSDANEVEYSVRDHGPGFRAEDLPRVFQPFFTRRRGGTGLGLAIVQRITDEHGGIVTAESHPAGGAVVHVKIPLYGAAETSS